MDAQFWNAKWNESKIGFHQEHVNSRLIKYWPQVIAGWSVERVFVPLCGKSQDMLWLRDQGHHVLGVELSTKAAEDFFTENELPVERQVSGDFEVFSGAGQGAGICLYVGDYFSLTPALIKTCQAFYDRASLIALPAEMRHDYAVHMAELLPVDSRGLLVGIAYNQEKMKGPPFSVPKAEVNELFANSFTIASLARFQGPDYVGNLADRGLETIEESVYLLQRTAN